jgi:hypothetical protein
MSTVNHEPDAGQGTLKHALLTLSNTTGNITRVAVPTWAKFARLYPLTQTIFFAYDENPIRGAAISTSVLISTGSLSVGGVAAGSQWESRVPSRAQELRLCSKSAGVQVELEFAARKQS